MSRARTLLVAVGNAFFDRLLEWVAGDARIEIVGTATSGAQALEVLDSLRAELVLVDVTLPDISGFELARRLKSGARAPLVVLLSFYDIRAARLAAKEAGADGFLCTSEAAERLMPLVGDLFRRRKATTREEAPAP